MSEGQTPLQTHSLSGEAGSTPIALREALLRSSGQDILRCTGCDTCSDFDFPVLDWSISEIFQMAARNDRRCLTSRTLQDCDIILERNPRCPAGLDPVTLILALHRLAEDSEQAIEDLRR